MSDTVLIPPAQEEPHRGAQQRLGTEAAAEAYTLGGQVGGGAACEDSPGTCWGVSSVGSCRLMKRRRPAAPNSRTDENMQASRMVPACKVIRALLWGRLSGVGGEFFLHRPHQASIRPV